MIGNICLALAVCAVPNEKGTSQHDVAEILELAVGERRLLLHNSSISISRLNATDNQTKYLFYSISVFLVCIFPVFNCMRRCRFWEYPYEVSVFNKREFRKWSDGCTSWVGRLWAIDDDKVYAACGLDALMFLRFQRLCLQLFFFCALWACLLIPLFYNTGKCADAKGLSRFSLSNLPTDVCTNTTFAPTLAPTQTPTFNAATIPTAAPTTPPQLEQSADFFSNLFSSLFELNKRKSHQGDRLWASVVVMVS
jgi:hypothetical protein